MTIINKDQFKLFIDAVSMIADQCRCHITKRGMSVISVDEFNIAMIGAELKVHGLPELTPGINVKKLSHFLKMIHSNEINVEFQKNVMIIVGDNITIKSPLVLDAQIRMDPNQPKVGLPLSVEFAGQDFVKAIKNSISINDKVRFVFENNCFYLVTIDDDENEVKIEIGENVIGKEGGSSLFSDKYLKRIIKPIKKDDKLTLYASTDHPFKLSFSRDNVHVWYMQAPRIEAD